MNRKFLWVAAWAFFLSTPCLARPKLVLAIVIDQFRADNVARFAPRFLPARDGGGHPGGFRYLLEKGAFFPQAQYDLLQPMTGPGHATVLTGTYPYLGGVPTNDWFVNGERVYCAEDPAFATVGKTKNRHHLGTSPRNFWGTTVGDELKNAGFASRVVSISLKDRAAIFLGGQRADLALWFDPDSFTWVSSAFYVKKLPGWVDELNAGLGQRAGQKFLWEAHGPDSSLAISNIRREGRYAEVLGDSFPHTITRGTLSELASPAGLDLTVDAAAAALRELRLGRNTGPDLLALSFSSHDYVGHGFGPNSRENEEMVVAEDRALARLFRLVQESVPGGLKNVAIVLTADHGVAPNAEWLAQHRVNAGTVDPEALENQVEERLEKKFGKADARWVNSVEFGFWFNRALAERKKVALGDLARETKAALLAHPAFAYAITADDVATRQLPPGQHERRILKTYVPGRSGDVVGLVKPFYYVKEHTGGHMADYSYDETVPILLVGEGVKPGKYSTRAEVVDIAPTLSFLLDVIPPSLSEGRVLSEVFRH